MSKFRDKPPTTDDKVIPFPAGGEMTFEQRKAELEAFDRAAGAELTLRLRYSMLRRTLDAIEEFDPVPDDWRAKLEGRDHPRDDDDGEDDQDEDEDDEDDDDL